MLDIDFAHERHVNESTHKPLQVDQDESGVENIHKGNQAMKAEAAQQAASISQAVNGQPYYYRGKNLSQGIEEKEQGDLGYRYADRGKVDRQDNPQCAYR